MSLDLNRKKDSHKGNNGKVLVIGGSELYTGAPALTAMATLRVGCDLAYIAAPRRAADICAKFSPDLITIPLEGEFLQSSHLEEIQKWVEKVDVVAIGPGLGQDEKTVKAVKEFVKGCEKPMVIDADAIKAVATDLEVLKGKKAILTPHLEEFKILSGKDAYDEHAKNFAKEHNVIIVLKGPIDIVTNGEEIKENNTGNEGMTVGGTGDVLTGVIAGLIAQKMDLFEAADIGTKINGIAGDLCEEEKSYDFTASDVLEKLAETAKKI